MTPAPYVFKNLLGFKTYEPPAEKWETVYTSSGYIMRRVDE